MNLYKMRTFILPLCLLAGVACTGKHSARTTEQTTDTTAVVRPAAAVLAIDTAGTVKGYETHTYALPVGTDGSYRIDVTSTDTGLIFILHDAAGNDATSEQGDTWSGKLQKGDYTLIVGLTRNAARKNPEKETKYTVRVERE